MTRYFITATGTGVGKTFTTCALLHAARQHGQQAYGYKPVISGWDESNSTDTAQIIQAAGHGQAVDAVSPWRFAAPLSPHLAAAKEGQELVLSELVKWSCNAMVGEGLRLIEGVGGVAVPLTNHHTTLDWMRQLALPTILVTGSYLGSISHTITALMALKQAGLQVAAMVMNESEGSSVSFAEAQEGLAPFIATIPLQIFQPRVSSYRDATAIHNLASAL